jgi:hypothetical protein
MPTRGRRWMSMRSSSSVPSAITASDLTRLCARPARCSTPTCSQRGRHERTSRSFGTEIWRHEPFFWSAPEAKRSRKGTGTRTLAAIALARIVGNRSHAPSGSLGTFSGGVRRYGSGCWWPRPACLPTRARRSGMEPEARRGAQRLRGLKRLRPPLSESRCRTGHSPSIHHFRASARSRIRRWC